MFTHLVTQLNSSPLKFLAATATAAAAAAAAAADGDEVAVCSHWGCMVIGGQIFCLFVCLV